MKSLFFHHPSSKSSTPSSPSTPVHHLRHRSDLSDSIVDDRIAAAEAIITKWDPYLSSYANITSLFYENRREARDFIRAVKDLQQAMHFYVSDNSTSNSQRLVNAQSLMQTAMKRLEKEFYQILAANRDRLDPDSVSGRSSTATRSTISDCDDDDGTETEEEDKILRIAGDSIVEVEREAAVAMTDLQAIAECMIQAGYGKECVKIYEAMRKSIVDEGLYRLGFDRTAVHHRRRRHHHQDWEVLEIKIKNWLNAVKVAVRTLFSGERALCDHVFAASDAIKESCFSDITKDTSMALFSFPESVAKAKKSPEMMFRLLEMYDTISELWPEIELIFGHDSTAAVLSQAASALAKLGDASRAVFAEFESSVEKDSSRLPIPGGGLHPLTVHVMNYVCFLGEYTGALVEIFADYPIQVPDPVMEKVLENSPSPENPLSAISVRLEWLILALLCKLDRKAELYKDVGLSYLFLANNLQYIVEKVRQCNLRYLIGDEWIAKQEAKARQYGKNYERVAWANVVQSLPPNPTADLPLEEAKEAFRLFNSAFEAAYRTQMAWVVPDGKLRDEIKVSIARKIVSPYRAFYRKYRVVLRDRRDLNVFVKFAPEDLENNLSDLFYGSGSRNSSGINSVSGSVQASPVHPSRGTGSSSSSSNF